MTFPSCLALGRQMMGRRARKDPVTHFLGCFPGMYLCTRRLEWQNSALELGGGSEWPAAILTVSE